MGRKTWDSLPGRRNIVVTRDAQWQAAGAERAGSLEEATALCADAPLAWVIGGAEIYRLALPLAHLAVGHRDRRGLRGRHLCAATGYRLAGGGARAARFCQRAGPYSFVTYQNTNKEA
jgi:dihydrofolate reductase